MREADWDSYEQAGAACIKRTSLDLAGEVHDRGHEN